MTRLLPLLALAACVQPRPEPVPPPEPLNIPQLIAICEERHGRLTQWSVSDFGGVSLFRCSTAPLENLGTTPKLKRPRVASAKGKP